MENSVGVKLVGSDIFETVSQEMKLAEDSAISNEDFWL